MSSLPSSPTKQPGETDPNIIEVVDCQKCDSRMGPLRVHKGSQRGKQEEMGKIVQTCTNYKCNWTRKHTRPYEFADAEALIVRIRCRKNRVSIPATALNQPLRLRSTVPQLKELEPTESLQCGLGSDGCRKRAAKTCIERLCKSCCAVARKAAMEDFQPRGACQAHKIPAVNDHDLALFQPTHTPSQTTASNTGSSRTTRSSSAREKQSSAIDPITTGPLPKATPKVSTAAPPAPVDPPYHSSSPDTSPTRTTAPTPTPTATSKTSSTSTPNDAKKPPRTRGLANPLGQKWTNDFQEAQKKKVDVLNKRAEKQGMDDVERKTVSLVIYTKSNAAPAIIRHYAENHPKFRLNQVVGLAADDFPMIDVHTHGELESYMTTTDTVITASKHGATVIRLRRNILQGINVEECPGIRRHLGLESSRKRAADSDNELVSPVKKARSVACTSTSSSAIVPIPTPTTIALPPLPSPLPSQAPPAILPTLHPSLPSQPLLIPAPSPVPAVSTADSTTIGPPFEPVLMTGNTVFPGSWSVYVWHLGNELITANLKNPDFCRSSYEKEYRKVFSQLTGRDVSYHRSTVQSFKKDAANAKGSSLWDDAVAKGNTTQGSWPVLRARLRKTADNQGSTMSHAITLAAPPTTVESKEQLPPITSSLSASAASAKAVEPYPQPSPLLPLSPLPQGLSLDFEPEAITIPELDICPCCGLPLDVNNLPDHLRTQLKTITNISMDKQREFCDAHRDANIKRVEVPDFDSLYRFALSYRTTLYNYFMHPSTSVFYLEATTAGNDIGSQLKSVERLSGGYYGSYGQHVVLYALQHAFSSQWWGNQIGKLHLVSFLLKVAVPHVIHAAVQRDLGVDFTEAGEIIRGNCSWGEDHYPERDDTVREAAALRDAFQVLGDKSRYEAWFTSGVPLTANEWQNTEGPLFT